MIAVMLFCTFAVVLLIAFGSNVTRIQNLEKNALNMQQQAQARIAALEAELMQARQGLMQSLEARLDQQKKLTAALEKIETMQHGRLFDQTLAKSALERGDRFRGVLEAVLKAQGVDEDKIATLVEVAEEEPES